MSWGQVVVLSVVQGLTEFLPVSSSGHLAIVSRIFFSGDAGASFTAVSQLGTEAAVLVYFARDIVRILKAWFNGLFVKSHRDADYRLGWYVIIGTIPICVLGLFFKDEIRSGVRNLVGGGDGPGGVLGGDRSGGVPGSTDPRHRATQLARCRSRRRCPVPGTGARRVALRLDDQRGAVPRTWNAN